MRSQYSLFKGLTIFIYYIDKNELQYLVNRCLLTSLIIITLIVLFPPCPVIAKLESDSPDLSSHNNVDLHILSAHSLRGIVGKFIKIKGTIVGLNTSADSINTNRSGIAYISILDIKDRVPVDLEDWSVEKGLYIPFIENGQSLPLEWDVRLVKAGSYTISILFSSNDIIFAPPVVSSRITMEVVPKHNLNPSNVLPIAFGVPTSLMGFFGILNYIRGRKTGIYS
jgi:hypothetical protein